MDSSLATGGLIGASYLLRYSTSVDVVAHRPTIMDRYKNLDDELGDLEQTGAVVPRTLFGPARTRLCSWWRGGHGGGGGPA
jgi:hypothetical protein